MLYTSQGTEKGAVYIKNLQKQSETWREPWKERWLNSYKHYRSYRKQSDYPLRSNLFIPYTWSLVEHVVPKMLNVVFNTQPIVAVTPRHEGIPVDFSSLLENVLDYSFGDDRADFYFNLKTFFKEAAIYGTSFGRVVPKFKGALAADLSFSHLEFQPFDLFNVFPDWRGVRLNQMKWMILRHDMDWDTLKLMEQQGFFQNVEGLKTDFRDRLGKETQDEFKKERIQTIERSDSYGMDERMVFKVLEYWDYDHILYVCGDTVLREEENPFSKFTNPLYPFVMQHYTQIPHELYGVGIPEMIEDLQEELNTFRNQRIDNVNLVINRMFIASKLADINVDNLISYPGNIIYTNDMEAIKPLETKDVTGSAVTEYMNFQQDVAMTTGIYGPELGEPQPARTPGVTTVRLQQAANVRFDGVIKDIEFGALRHLARTYISMIWSFMKPTDFAKVVGLESFVEKGGIAFFETPPEEVLRNFHFQVAGSATTAVKEMRAQQIIQLFQFFQKDPYIDPYELRKMLFEAMDFKETKRLLKRKPMISIEQAQKMIQQAGKKAYDQGMKDGVKSQRGQGQGQSAAPPPSTPQGGPGARPPGIPGGSSPENQAFQLRRTQLSPEGIMRHAGQGGMNQIVP